MSKKWVYLYKDVDEAQKLTGSWEGVRALMGGKGANLAEMARIDLPVPPGFTVTTEACNAYLAAGQKFADDMWEQELEAVKAIEAQTGKELGNPNNPLLVSCRSGAKFSMPGMMDTVLNIGLNDEVVEGLAKLTGDARFAYDSYRRLVQMFGTVVMDIDDEPFEEVLAEARKKAGVKTDTELNAEQWKEVTAEFKKIFKEETGRDFPQDPIEQIKLSTEAVFKSWNGKRAIDYRNAAHIAHDLGTAVNMVTMVFGNMGNTSGTGVAFTRNPSDDTDEIYGDYLINAQGEDVVAGIRNTEPIVKLGQDLPEAYQEFLKVCRKLEDHYREMQDVEFTIEQGKLWMLQTRDGKRTAKSAIKIGVDMANDGFISKEQAVLRVSPQQVDTLLHPQFDIEAKKSATSEGKLLAKGVNASPGAAVGVVAFDADLAEEWGKKEGKPVIMVRPFTRPDDVHGMLAAKGILTSEGGATSHAAVVARQFGVPCIVGASDVVIDQSRRQFIANSVTVKEGEWVSIDGSTGEAFVGEIPMVSAALEEQEDLQTLLSWADQFRRLQVWANADYPEDAERARSFGAQGIGLCRTEYMFFQEERLPTVQKMILADNDEVRDQALAILLPFQREDFAGLFRAMDGLPVIIRLIDPPLHEFMPEKDEILTEVVTMRAKGETKGLAEKEHLLSAIDQDGVGQLMKMATERGRATRSDLEVGICGEHGGDPESVEFCHRINLNYVSCSPFRVPIARLAAAQAALKEKGVSAK